MKTIDLEKSTMDSQIMFPYTTLEEIPLYDQRYMPRWPMQGKAYYRIQDLNIIFKTQLKDLSPTGLCLLVSPDVHAAQKLELKIYLSERDSFEAIGTVMWKRSVDSYRSYAGILFERVSQEVQDLILNYAYGNYQEI